MPPHNDGSQYPGIALMVQNLVIFLRFVREVAKAAPLCVARNSL